jgi:hypothetical protein
MEDNLETKTTEEKVTDSVKDEQQTPDEVDSVKSEVQSDESVSKEEKSDSKEEEKSEDTSKDSTHTKGKLKEADDISELEIKKIIEDSNREYQAMGGNLTSQQIGKLVAIVGIMIMICLIAGTIIQTNKTVASRGDSGEQLTVTVDEADILQQYNNSTDK